MVKWKYVRELSDWDNTVSLVNFMGYKPKTSTNILVANLLLHFEGIQEDDEQRTIKSYLEDGIWRGEEGTLSDFDYE